MADWASKTLRKGNKVILSYYYAPNSIVKAKKLKNGDRLVFVPFHAAAKVGDLVYARVNNRTWGKVWILAEMKDGVFKVTSDPKALMLQDVKFEDIYGVLYEIRRRPLTNSTLDEDFPF